MKGNSFIGLIVKERGFMYFVAVHDKQIPIFERIDIFLNKVVHRTGYKEIDLKPVVQMEIGSVVIGSVMFVLDGCIGV